MLRKIVISSVVALIPGMAFAAAGVTNAVPSGTVTTHSTDHAATTGTVNSETHATTDTSSATKDGKADQKAAVKTKETQKKGDGSKP